jgi:hypothetical protein
VFEKDLPKGQKLLLCSKCKATFYKDRDAQTQHWPFHKQVCCRADEDIKARQFLQAAEQGSRSIDTAFETIEVILDPQNVSLMKGRTLVYCLQYLKWYLNEKEAVAVHESEELKHRYSERIRESIFMPMSRKLWPSHACEENRERYLTVLWAVPGFTSWALSEDLLISKQMKELDAKGFHLWEIEPQHKTVDPWGEIVFWLFSFSACVRFDNDLHRSILRETPLGLAVIKRLMKNWSSSFIRTCSPQPRLKVLYSNIFRLSVRSLITSPPSKAMKEATDKTEVVPGLMAQELIRAFEIDFMLAEYKEEVFKLGSLIDAVSDTFDAFYCESGPFAEMTSVERLVSFQWHLYQCYNRPLEAGEEESVHEIIHRPLLEMIYSKNSKIIF